MLLDSICRKSLFCWGNFYDGEVKHIGALLIHNWMQVRREIFGLAFILCIVGIVISIAHHMGISLCLFRRLTGLPCPCCGMTRACFAVLKGNLVEAVRSNPLVVSAIFISPFALPMMIQHKNWPRLVVIVAKVLVPVAVLCNWVYLLFRQLGR